MVGGSPTVPDVVSDPDINVDDDDRATDLLVYSFLNTQFRGAKFNKIKQLF